MANKRPIRIGAISGAVGDRVDGFEVMAARGQVDVLFGDYLAEINLASRALDMSQDPTKGYEVVFALQLERAIENVVKNQIKVIVNAGALNVHGLAELCDAVIKKHGHSLKLAYVTGDNVFPDLPELLSSGETFPHLEDANRPLWTWDKKPITANGYIGCWGIVEALKQDADIIITGRVTDASPVIAAAAWWHGWGPDAYDELAGALMAGHCIECGAYVTGGNFSGFKELLPHYYDFGWPIAEVDRDGTFTITKHDNTNGLVSVDTVRSQILYEIQGDIYLNPDVQADISHIAVEPAGKDRVKVMGISGSAAPATTKVAICALAGYQAEINAFASGLDVTEKFESFKAAALHRLGSRAKKFSVLDFTQYGVPQPNAPKQALGSAMFRVFAQAKEIEAFGPTKHMAIDFASEGLGHYPGMFVNVDMRLAVPRPFIEYWPARMNVSRLKVETRFLGSDQVILTLPPQKTIAVIPSKSYEPSEAFDAAKWGATTRGPVGQIAHGRSGDKGGNVNFGLFVRHADEYAWLSSLLTTKKCIELLGEEYHGQRIERVEFPGLWAVHFVVHDILDNGISSTPRLDGLGKGFVEWIRGRYVDVPDVFLARGII